MFRIYFHSGTACVFGTIGWLSLYVGAANLLVGNWGGAALMALLMILAFETAEFNSELAKGYLKSL